MKGIDIEEIPYELWSQWKHGHPKQHLDQGDSILHGHTEDKLDYILNVMQY